MSVRFIQSFQCCVTNSFATASAGTGRRGLAALFPHPTSHTPHPTPHTPHTTHHTPHPTPHTQHPTPHPPHPTQHTTHNTQHTQHTTHPTPCSLEPTPWKRNLCTSPCGSRSRSPRGVHFPLIPRQALRGGVSKVSGVWVEGDISKEGSCSRLLDLCITQLENVSPKVDKIWGENAAYLCEVIVV